MGRALYMLPLFVLNNESPYTLPLGVRSFAPQYSVDTARVLGGLTGAVKG